MALIKCEKNWQGFLMVQELLNPMAIALDVGQTNSGGLSMVMMAILMLVKRFDDFKYPRSEEGQQLKSYCLARLKSQRSYLFRPVHTIDYLFDPRFVNNVFRPSQTSFAAAVELMLTLAKAHDARVALLEAKESDVEKLPANFSRVTKSNMMREYPGFRSRTGCAFIMDTTWDKSTVRNPLRWWRTGRCTYHLCK